MTITELRNMSEAEIENLFNSMPEPRRTRRVVLDRSAEPIDKIIKDFSKFRIKRRDRTALQRDLIAMEYGG